jgi:diguanylate cyclase (GGDEF)-like protein
MNLEDSIQQLDELVLQIRQVSFADDKTSLKNALALRNEVRLIEEGQSEFDVVVFGDLNGFKALNDNYGHEAGDIALRSIGETIQKEIVGKLKAKAFRRSGDEFVILLKQKNVKRFESIAKKFKSLAFSHNDISLEPKMSFGLIVSDGKTDFNDMLLRAEVACSVAKSKGHGICITWGPETERESLKEFRKKCDNCGSVTRCNVPNRHRPERLTNCSFCGTAY